jgi:hypothetical protein
MNIMTREELHRLVDTLSEAALEPAEAALQHFQVWPRQPPPEIDRMNREHHERMLQSMRPGTISGGGVGAIRLGAAVEFENGRFSFSRWEDKTAVAEAHNFHDGHKITVTERLRMDDDGNKLIYAPEMVGPKGKAHRHEITFAVE